MSKRNEVREVHLGAQGRLVIPAALRRSLGFAPGDVLVARSEDGRLVLEKAETVRKRLRDSYGNLRERGSLADELIAERRAAARRED